jgi:hypothetical protein
VPFYLGAGMLVVAIGVLATAHRLLAAADAGETVAAAGRPADEEAAEEAGEVISVGLSD